MASHLIPSHQGRPSDDPIFALNKEATARKATGQHVVNATVGALLNDDGSLAIMATASRAVRAVPDSEWAPYAPIGGSQDFLDAVIADTFSSEPELRASAIGTATPGGSGALRHAIANYLEPGQALLTTSFFWGPYQTLCDEADRKIATFPMFGEDGKLDVAALDRAVGEQLSAQGRVLLFLNDPCHNPTGYSMHPSEWKQVVEVLLAHATKGPVTLLVDTAYFAYNAQDPRAFLKELRPLLGQTGLLFAWSASKTYTHYGLRVGALVACIPDAVERARAAAAFSYSSRGTWSNCSRGGMRAITQLLVDPALAAACDEERHALKALLGERVAAFNALAPHKGLRYPRYEGGFFVTVFADDGMALAARMKEMAVYVVPAKNAVRVALCGVPAVDVERLVDALSIAAT